MTTFLSLGSQILPTWHDSISGPPTIAHWAALAAVTIALILRTTLGD